MSFQTSLASRDIQSRDLKEESGKVTDLRVLEVSTWQREPCGSPCLTAGMTSQSTFWSSWPGAL